jgi:hypothetical protein
MIRLRCVVGLIPEVYNVTKFKKKMLTYCNDVHYNSYYGFVSLNFSVKFMAKVLTFLL